MKKHDDEIKQAFAERFGSMPEVVGYAVDSPPLWLMILLAGGLLAAFMQTPWMIGFYGDEVRFIKTSVWKTTKLEDETLTLKKSDITDAQLKKFGPALYFKFTTTEGRKFNLAMNKFYKALEGNPAAIEAMKKFCGVTD